MTQLWFVMLAGLFLGTFIHEDITLAMASYFIVEGRLPWQWALLAVYSGMVTSDLSIYGLGAAARRVRWLRYNLIGTRITTFQKRLNDNLFAAIALCRIMPGVLFPTFVACGWFGVRFRRFFAASALMGAIYAPIMLFLMVAFGTAVLRRIGHWGWIAGIFMVLLFVLWHRLKPVHPDTRVNGILFASGSVRQGTHEGMPAIKPSAPRISPAERIHFLIFYAPVALWWLALAVRYHSLTLPTVTNPKIEMAGLWGESKSSLMDQVGTDHRRWVAPFVVLNRTRGPGTAEGDFYRAVSSMREASISFPLVAKPDIGWQGYGVQKIGTPEKLGTYIESFPAGEKFILQKLIPFDAEAGVFYIRRPDDDKGTIASLTFRYFPFLVGDGASSVKDLIAQDPRAEFKSPLHLGRHRRHLGIGYKLLDHVPALGEVVRLSFICSLRVGGLYYDAHQYITPALIDRFDSISCSMPEFYFGRFDIRFESVDKLSEGEGFYIIEINGAGSEAIDIWDPRKSISEIYHELFHFYAVMYEIADLNRSHGFRPTSLSRLVKWTWHYNNMLKQYPPSG